MTIAAYTEEYAAEQADAFEPARSVAGRGDVVAKILKSSPADALIVR